MSNQGNQYVGMPPEEIALREDIKRLAAEGKHEERERAADRLAAMIMRRTVPRRDD